MTLSHFFNRVPKRPFRRWSEAKDRRPPSTSFVHRVAVRPTRFRLVPGQDPAWSDGPVVEHLGNAPTRRAFYVGRIQEVGDGQALVELWEVPSGRVMLSTLDVDENLVGPSPAVGDQLLLWTWIELPGKGRFRPRYLGSVRRRWPPESDLEGEA